MTPISSSGASPQGGGGRPPGRRVGAGLLLTLLVALAVYGLALRINQAYGIDSEAVIRDLAQSCGLALGVGMLSNFGYLLWAAAAAIALFGASLEGGESRQRQLLLCGGSFSALLCLDDMFLLHDKYIGSGFLYLLYIVFALLILLRFRRLVWALGGLAFPVAVMLLGSSILLDKVQDVLPFGYDNSQLFEEGFKFLGIAAWVHFWWQAAAAGLRRTRPAS
jgi:hypothetical protein